MLPRQAQGGLGAETQGSAAIHCVRTYHAARRAAFQDYYALKSHYVPTILPRLALPNPPRRAPRRLQARYGFQERRLLRSEFSSRGGAAARVHASSPMSSPMSSPWARRAGDVAPYHGCHGACAWVRAWRVHGAWTWCVLCMLVGADVPGGPRTRVVPDVIPVGAARRGRRALPWAPWCVCMGTGMACAWCVDMVCMVRDGRGRRPRRPAYTCRSRCRPRVRGAPGTSRPPLGAPTLKDNLRTFVSPRAPC